MVTIASVIQICNVPLKRLIHLIIFILIGLKFGQTFRGHPDQYDPICWTTHKDHSYQDVFEVDATDVTQCKEFCENMDQCNLVVFNHRTTPNTCMVKNNSDSIMSSKFVLEVGVYAFRLDTDCARNISNCWITKGDTSYAVVDTEQVNVSMITPERCKYVCTQNINCNLVLYIDNLSFLNVLCKIKVKKSPLSKFPAIKGVTVYLLKDECRSIDYNVNDRAISWVGKYHMFTLTAVWVLS